VELPQELPSVERLQLRLSMELDDPQEPPPQV
jgi:hypothetical protein